MACVVGMKIVFMGTPDFVVPVLEGLLHGGHRIVGVYTRPDRPAGRGRRLTPPPVKAYAHGQGLAVFQPASLREEDAVQELAALHPDVIIVAAYGRILPPEMLEVLPKRVLNPHPSLLPKHRGPSPVTAAVLEGGSITGITVMLMDQGMDTGPIVTQRQVPILPGETADMLTRRLFREGTELLLEALPEWQAGALKAVPQDEGKATSTRFYSKEDGELDWSLPAATLERRVRAFDPWPGGYTRWEGKLLKVLEATLVGDGAPQEGRRGQVVTLSRADKPTVAVITGQGLLGLMKVQLESRQPQPVREFIRGYPRFMGAWLPS